MKNINLVSLTICLILVIVLVISASALADIASETKTKSEQHFKKANDLLKCMEYEAAIAEYSKVIELSSDSKIAQNAQYWIGQSQFRAGHFDAAQATFDRLLKDHPTSAIIPVTQLMVQRVQQAKKNEDKRRASSNAAGEGKFVDPDGVTYTRIKTFTGRRDIVTQAAYQLKLSPNGKFLLWNKIVIPLDEGEPFDLVDMPAALGMWSPDGKKVLFRSGGAFWMVPVSPETGRSTGEARKLLDGRYQYDPYVSWSSDSEKIVFERRGDERSGNIYTLSVGDDTLTQITNDPIREWRPIWSPDGKSIVYSRGSELRVVPAGGGASRKLVDNGLARSWTPDSKWIGYFWNGETRFLRLVDGYEFVWNERSNPPGAFISWSPDRKKMLFYCSSYNWNSALKVVSASGGPSFELGMGSQLEPYRQYWSRDSRMIVTGGEGGFWVVPIAGGEPFPLKLDVSVEGEAESYRLSPDGGKLLFGVVRSDKLVDLYVVPVSLREGRTVGSPVMIFSGWKKQGDYARYLLWSPDGTRIALGHEENIWMVLPDGGEPVQVTMSDHSDEYRAPGWSLGGNPVWSPDGTMFGYKVYKSEEEQVFRVIRVSGNGNTIILDIPGGGGYEWSADSNFLLAGSDEGISAISIADGQSQSYLDLKGLSMETWGFVSSPDRKTLAFVGRVSGTAGDGSQDTYKIFTVPAQGGDITELAADDPGEKYWLWWSPDGKWISYQSDGFVKTRSEGAIWEADFEEIVKNVLDK